MTEQYMSMKEAGEYLNISRTKIWNLFKQGILNSYIDQLDHRKRLVRREDVEKLKQPKRIE